MNRAQVEKFYPIIVSVVSLFFYLITLNQSVDFVDSGELTAVSYTLGIVHPTGYPFFTIISHVFITLPFPFRVIVKANIFSALVSSVSLYFFTRFLISNANVGTRSVNLWALISSLILCFTQFFWEQAVKFEVYSFQMLLMSLILFSAFEFRRTEDFKYLFLLSFLLGLSFTNHLITIFILPGVIYLLMFGFLKRIKVSVYVLMLLFFILGLTPLIYLPIRAGSGVELNWGDPKTLENFINHITGKQYRVWAFSSLDVMLRQLSYFVSKLPENFGYLSLFFGVVGFSRLFKLDKKLFYFTFLSFLTCVLISANYDIHDINAYFLLSLFMISVWIFYGFVYLSRRIPKPFLILVGIISISLVFLVNFKKVDRSKNYLPEVYTLHILNDVKPGSIIISYQWDYFISPGLYFQLVEGVRKDVVLIDKELLRRSWYIKQLEQNYPWLIENSRADVDLFLAELYKFEHDLPYNPMEIEKKFVAMINSFIDANIGSRPIYVGIEIEPEFGFKYQRVPEGFMFRLYAEPEYKSYDYKPIDISRRVFDVYSENLVNLIVKMIINRGIYELRFGEKERARFYFEEALRIKPESAEARLWLEKVKSY